MKTPSPPHQPFDRELDELLHPAQAFAHPRDVLRDPDLTVNEKRAILASWASDACAVEANPALRRPRGSRQAVTVDEILEALRKLDVEAGAPGQSSWAVRQVRRTAISAYRSRRSGGDAGSGPALSH
jgi:hypothetical protein